MIFRITTSNNPIINKIGYRWCWRHNCIACKWMTFKHNLTWPNLTFKPTTYHLKIYHLQPTSLLPTTYKCTLGCIVSLASRGAHDITWWWYLKRQYLTKFSGKNVLSIGTRGQKFPTKLFIFSRKYPVAEKLATVPKCTSIYRKMMTPMGFPMAHWIKNKHQNSRIRHTYLNPAIKPT